MWIRWGSEASSRRLPEPVRLPSPSPPDMEAPSSPASLHVPKDTTKLVERYLIVCKGLQVTPNPSVLTFIRLRNSELRPERWLTATGEVKFADSDMYAFCDFVLRERSPCALFDHWSHFDGQDCAIGATGCQMLSRVLALPEACVHTIDLRNQQIGTRGARALVEVIRSNPRVVHVGLYGSFIEDPGARLFADLLHEAGAGARSLETLDLSVNMVSLPVCQQLQLVRPPKLHLVLKGNRVLDEVLNASSHAVGVILVILGAIFLGIAVADHPSHGLGPDGTPLTNAGYVTSIVLYLVSLFFLYLASTLYHSMFAMGDAILEVFAVFDQSAIYLLIAGSYTPFLTILFPDRPLYSTWLLGFLWLMALAGIVLHLTYYGPYKTGLQVSTYIGMGWAALVCITDINARLSAIDDGLGMWLLLGGGVMYTAGVPFFIKDSRTIGVPDHTIWHLFVMAASAMHYYCVLWYLVRYPYQGVPLPWAEQCGEACVGRGAASSSQ